MTVTSLRPRLLMVEPDDSVRRVLGRVLGRRFEITPLATGRSALGRLAEERFDVMILDLFLGDMAGLAFLRAARAIDETLPIIVTTPIPQIEMEQAAASFGAIAFVPKPFDTPDLDAPLARATELARARRLAR